MKAKGYNVENDACPLDERIASGTPINIEILADATQDKDPQCFVRDD